MTLELKRLKYLKQTKNTLSKDIKATEKQIEEHRAFAI